MQNTRIKVISDLYQLPHFFGIWVSDPELLAMKEEVTGGTWMPRVVMFVDGRNGFELSITVSDIDKYKFQTEYMQFQCKIHGPELTFQRYFLDGDKETKFFPRFQIEWGITEDGRLNFTYDDDTQRYVPATIAEMEELGFDSEMMREIIEIYVSRGRFFKETFDLNTAYRLIDEAISREEDDAGMERGALGRPDPTTWVFGGDRFTGTV